MTMKLFLRGPEIEVYDNVSENSIQVLMAILNPFNMKVY